MKTKCSFIRWSVLLAVTLVGIRLPSLLAQTTAFTYQGQLTQDEAPAADGLYQLRFQLFDSALEGSQLSTPHTFANVPVTNGLFTVKLDFGDDVFATTGDVWMQISFRTNLAPAFTSLSPRQEITSTPFAITALRIAGALPDVQLSTNVSLLNAAQTYTASKTFSAGAQLLLNAGSAAAPGLAFDGDGNSGLARPAANSLALITEGIERLRVDSSGRVGVGITSPPVRLTVAGSGIYNSATAAALLLTNNSANGRGWEWHALDSGSVQLADFTAAQSRVVVNANGDVGIGETSPSARLDVRHDNSTVANFNRTGTDGLLVDFQRDGAKVGGINVAGGVVTYNAFTGSHYAWTADSLERGMLVSMTGKNRRRGAAPTSEIIYGVESTRTANDARCLGSYLGLEEPRQAASDRNPHQIMSVGNGEMWVTEGKGGDLQPGDYLISSTVPGCAMKHDPAEFPVGYICARAAEPVNWGDVAPGKDGAKRKRISVLFESFVRDTPHARYEALVQSQQKRIASLESELKTLRSLHDRLVRLETTLSLGAAGIVVKNEGSR